MRGSDYPWLHTSSNAASSSAQQSYFRSLRVQLSVFALVSVIGATLSLLDTQSKRFGYGAIAILLVVGIVFVGYVREQRVDRRWFNARAVAESVKTASWRYMMQAPPFDNSQDVETAFIRELDTFRKARPGLEQYLITKTTNAPAVTSYMKGLRESSLDQRKEAYLRDRLDDQIEWYSRKSRENGIAGQAWFWSITGLQVVAAIAAGLAAARGAFSMNWVSVAMTIAAAVTGWSQAKRHDELAISYAVAAQDLIQIKSLLAPVSEETAFRELVDQGEEAVSREHTMWCARRTIPTQGRSR
jgi:ABC-type multidrug transport system fused ATPase/permease subunit